jgi:hypothetical protein
MATDQETSAESSARELKAVREEFSRQQKLVSEQKTTAPRLIANDFFSYLAVTGAAITLLGSLDPLLQIAGWAKIVVESWRDWTGWVWSWLFSAFGIKMTAFSNVLLTATVFYVIIILTSTELVMQHVDPIVNKSELLLQKYSKLWRKLRGNPQAVESYDRLVPGGDGMGQLFEWYGLKSLNIRFFHVIIISILFLPAFRSWREPALILRPINIFSIAVFIVTMTLLALLYVNETRLSKKLSSIIVVMFLVSLLSLIPTEVAGIKKLFSHHD